MSNYAPLGSLCQHCKKRLENCSRLPFNEYKVVLKSQDGWNYVACKEYDSLKSKPKESVV